MRQSFRSRFLAVLVVMLLAVAMAQPVFADDESDLQDLKDQQSSVQQEQDAANAELAATQAKVDEMDAAIRELDQKIGEAESAILALDEAIEENLQLLDETKEELVQAEADEEIWYEKLKLRIKAMYESGDVNYLEVLLQAESMSELFSKAEYSKELVEYDREIMDNLTACRETIQTKQAEIEEEEAALEQNRAEEQQKKEELQEAKEAKDAEMAELQSDADALALYEQQLEAEKESLLAEITQLQKDIEAKQEAERLAAEKAAEEQRQREQAEQEAAQAAQKETSSNNQASDSSQSTQDEADPPTQNDTSDETSGSDNTSDSGSTGGSGGMVWPVSGYSYLSTYFGEGGHRGIDIPAPSGTPIRAAASGTVITASYNSSYGNYVAISHGNGMVTVYAHASALCVSVGQTVSAGETVALVGTTGYSTGNHLHFEVQINGGLYNPLNYVSP